MTSLREKEVALVISSFLLAPVILQRLVLQNPQSCFMRMNSQTLKLIYLTKICQLFNLSCQEHRYCQCRKKQPF
nr:MAG TPA: hypothetical protein [Caudoviricetes sp.]